MQKFSCKVADIKLIITLNKYSILNIEGIRIIMKRL